MIIQCTHCLSKFRFDERKLEGAKSKKVRCTKCSQVFTVISQQARQHATESHQIPKGPPTASRTPTGEFIPLNEPDFGPPPGNDLSGMPPFPEGESEIPSHTQDAFSDSFGDTRLPPPDESTQIQIHHELYKPDTVGMHVSQKVAEFTEVYFDASKRPSGPSLELEDDRMFQYGAADLDKVQMATKTQTYKVQPLSGKRLDGATKPTDVPRLFSLLVRLLLICLILVTLLIGMIMIKEGESFNIAVLKPANAIDFVQNELLPFLSQSTGNR